MVDGIKGVHWPKPGIANYHAQLELQDKVLAIIGCKGRVPNNDKIMDHHNKNFVVHSIIYAPTSFL